MIRLAALLAIGLIAAACPRAPRGEPSTTEIILAAVKDSILRGGEATRLVEPPRRGYQRPARPDALPALGRLLGLPIERGTPRPLSCRWAPADSAAIGMNLTVTGLEVVGDSAKVSVLRYCLQRDHVGTTRYELEPSWFLRRVGGRWVVVRTVKRVTAHPDIRVHAVG